MAKIIEGTTPKIKYKFKTIDVNTIDVAILTIQKDGNTVITKQLSDATIGDGSLTWRLSQQETLSLGVGEVDVMLNWRVGEERGVGNQINLYIGENPVREVI